MTCSVIYCKLKKFFMGKNISASGSIIGSVVAI